MATATKLKLHTMLGNYPNTQPLKSGAVKSDLVDFDFAEVKVANTLFKKVVRDASYDVAELAIVTYLQAKSFNKPYVLIPAVVVSRGQHHTIAYNPERGTLKPTELNGKRVGVRAYTVTTGTWLRGVLASDYGIDIDSIEWITFEDPHVAEYHDPAIVKRAPQGKDMVQMLLDGEIDAAIVGDKLPDPRLKHLIADHEAAAKRWAGLMAACRSITWWWCAKACRDRTPTPCARCFASCTRARAPPAWRTARRSIRTVSASRPAGRSWRSSSTSATGKSSSSAASRSMNCSTTPRAR